MCASVKVEPVKCSAICLKIHLRNYLRNCLRNCLKDSLERRVFGEPFRRLVKSSEVRSLGHLKRCSEEILRSLLARIVEEACIERCALVARQSCDRTHRTNKQFAVNRV